MTENGVRSAILLFVLLNPFLLTVYLADLVRQLEARQFVRTMVRGGMISAAVFALFALCGDAIFTKVLQVRFSSFMIFGGVAFFLVGIQFVFAGGDAMRSLRGAPKHVEGSVALPFMIGPATLNASILAGSRSAWPEALGAIGLAVGGTVVCMVAFKHLHDWVQQRNEELIERYLDIAGRSGGLVIGSLAIEMMVQGIEAWLSEAFPGMGG